VCGSEVGCDVLSEHGVGNTKEKTNTFGAVALPQR